MAGRRGTPLLPNSSAGTEAWPPGFAYDLDVILPPVPPPSRSLSFADVAANRRQGQRRSALRAEIVSSSDKEGAVRRS